MGAGGAAPCFGLKGSGRAGRSSGFPAGLPVGVGRGGWEWVGEGGRTLPGLGGRGDNDRMVTLCKPPRSLQLPATRSRSPSIPLKQEGNVSVQVTHGPGAGQDSVSFMEWLRVPGCHLHVPRPCRLLPLLSRPCSPTAASQLGRAASVLCARATRGRGTTVLSPLEESAAQLPVLRPRPSCA